MSQRARTPRQRQGDGLVPLMVRVTPEMRERVRDEAVAEDCSESSIVRIALEEFFNGPDAFERDLASD